MRGTGALVRDVNTMSAMFLHRLARELDRHKPLTMAEANLQWETAEVEPRVLILGHVGEGIGGRNVGFDSLKSRLNCNFRLMWKDQRRRGTRRSRLFIISSQTTASGSPTSLVLPHQHRTEVDCLGAAHCPLPRRWCLGAGSGAPAEDNRGQQPRETIPFSSMSRFHINLKL